MTPENLLCMLRSSTDTEQTQAFKWLLNQDSCDRAVLLTMLQCYYRTRSSAWGSVEKSPSVWTTALSKHLPAIVEELKATSVEPGSNFKSKNFESSTLTTSEYSSLWHSFSYVAVPPAENLFASLVQDRAFLRKLAATEYCLGEFSMWMSYSSCRLSSETVEAIMRAIESPIEDDLDRHIVITLLRDLTDFFSSSKRYSSEGPLFHPQFVSTRKLVIEKLREGLDLDNRTLENIVSNSSARELSCVVDSVKNARSRGSGQTLKLALDFMEQYLEEIDPITEL